MDELYKKQVNKAAASILKTVQNSFDGEHVYREINPKDFKYLDIKFYNRCQSEFEKNGFKHLGDIIDDKIINMKPSPRCFQRIVISEDGHTSATFYHSKPTLFWRFILFLMKTPAKAFELQTEFSDGRWLLTTIIPEDILSSKPSDDYYIFCDKKTLITEAWTQHNNKIAEIISKHDITPVKFESLDEICKSENRQYSRLRKHLDDIGWVTEEYIEKQSGKKNKFSHDVYEEVQRLVRKQLITGNID